MRLLLDTHLLLWAAEGSERLSRAARTLLNDSQNVLMFSAVSLWEVAIKQSIGRSDFEADARLLRRGLLDNGYDELVLTSAHAVALDGLPPLHKDPFDRMLVAQAQVEGITLVTSDATLARYPIAIRRV